ncbi:MAG: hypothetical protein EHM23_31655, partial [Acidobacteria bacterium]
MTARQESPVRARFRHAWRPAAVRRWILLGIVLSAAGVPGLFGQAPEASLQFKHLTAEDGLSHSWIRAILQDSRGYMWLGTYSGLDRYDGYKFKAYNREKGNPHSLLNGAVACLFEDRQKRLWVGHMEGLSLYRPATDDFDNFCDAGSSRARGSIPLEGLGSLISSILEDESGKLWLASDSGLLLFDPEARKILNHYRHDPSDPNTLSQGEVRHIVRDKSGNLWLAVTQGLNRFNPRTNRVTRFSRGREGAGLPSNEVLQLAIDQYNYLWIGTAGGLCRLKLDQPDPPTIEWFRHDGSDPN